VILDQVVVKFELFFVVFDKDGIVQFHAIFSDHCLVTFALDIEERVL